MDNLADVISIRKARYSDRPYILRTWLSSYAKSSIAKALGQAYYRAWSGVAEAQYSGGQEIRVACLNSNEDIVVGFAVLDGPGEYWFAQVHYVYVREAWRRKGVAKMLLGGLLSCSDVAYTHTPPTELRDKVPVTWQYAPRLTHKT